MRHESRRMEAVQASHIPAVAALLHQYPDTITLGQGVMHYGPPPEVRVALGRFFEDPSSHKYKPEIGIKPLIDALTCKLETESEFQILPESRIVVTAGSNMAFLNAILAIADPGDEIIVPVPFYFNHEMTITMAGARPVFVPADGDYQLRLDAIKAAITPRTRAILTVSPNNPTGVVYPQAALRVVNELCRQRGIYHISDEAYEYFTYGSAAHFSPGSIPGSAEHTISLFTLSKTYGFASWRIGYMVIPEHLLEAVRKIQETNIICPPVISQFAALGALEAGAAFRAPKIAEMAATREIVLGELESVRDFCDTSPSDGAIYVFLRLHSSLLPMILVERLVREQGVAVLPGSDFGMMEGCSLRISYGALPRQMAAEGVGRLVRGLAAIVKEGEAA